MMMRLQPASMMWRARSSSRAQQRTFTAIYERNGWGDEESVSGPGSTLARAGDYLNDLLAMLDAFGVRSLVDAPCGDFNWMRRVVAARPLEYTGVDIVQELIAGRARADAGPGRHFLCLDMTRGELPRADLILCRDGLVHLSFADARAARSVTSSAAPRHSCWRRRSSIGRAIGTCAPAAGARSICRPRRFTCPRRSRSWTNGAGIPAISIATST